MAEDTQKPVAPEKEPVATEEVLVVEQTVTEKDPPLANEPGPEHVKEEELVVEEPKPAEEESKISQSTSFKEETNLVGELPDTQKKALEELKVLIQETLNKHEFSTPPVAKEEEKPEEEEKIETQVEVKEEEAVVGPPEAKIEEKVEALEAESKEEKLEVKEEEGVEKVEAKIEEKVEALEGESKEEEKVEVEEEKGVEKVEALDEDGAKTVEAIEETIVAVSGSAPPSVEEEAKAVTGNEGLVEEEKLKEEVEATEVAPPEPSPPEEVFIWGIPLLGDEKSDVILLKFLRARDFKVKDAFLMIKNTVKWRKEFGIEGLLEEDLGNELEKAVFMHGFDKEGHPVCYNVYGAFQDKDLYQNCFGDEEKRKKFLRWRIQFLEKSIRKLDFSPTGICTFVQVNDFKNSPGPAKRELRQATKQALTLLQDNYPEFVAKQVFINVPWWYLAFNRMISPFLTQRTKSKFVFAGPSKSAETLFKYLSPEQVPVQYGGLSREGEQEFTVTESITEVTVSPTTKHSIEIPLHEKCSLVWELRVIGWDVNYGAEFVPAHEEGYTVIVSKTRKVIPTDDPFISDTYKIGEAGKIVLTIDNQTSKKKKLLYRHKVKPLVE